MKKNILLLMLKYHISILMIFLNTVSILTYNTSVTHFRVPMRYMNSLI